ncbi:hypothetical protein FQY83_12745 [Luteimonas marina]|uniref:DUF4156 domain-containing protein n=1 Tax=Luteimonas marina TaxID=488485 RepID=A0A5C5U1C1_9GAMM|nr:hypothetical protein [Luteimonas marina]TWT19220.1 hypothetical protein FQY83_12745 [Luteimonas marina]
MRRPALVLLSSIAALLLAACTSSHVLTGTPRPPIDPSQVRLYYGPPPGGFEEIARLDVSSGAFTYGEQNKTNSVLRKLREEAARLGANGILFQGTADGHGGGGVSVGGGLGRGGGRSYSGVGVGVDISPRQKYANGIAIWVPDPPPAP